MKDSTELDRILWEFIVAGGFDASDLPRAFRSAVGVLKSAGVRYAVVGRIALARYSRAQCLHVIALRLDESVGDDLVAELNEAVRTVLTPASSVRLEVGFATSATERRFLELASSTSWLGTDAVIASAEHLLWFCLTSGDGEAYVDAIHLCQTPDVDWANFAAIVGPDDPRLVRRALSVRRRAERQSQSTFSAMMERRVAELRRREEQEGLVAPVPVYRLKAVGLP